MTVLFISGHPAQIHNFRIVKELLEKKGHKVFWVSSKKDISFQLLRLYGIDFTEIIKPEKNFISKIHALFTNTRIIYRLLRKNKVDLIVSRVSPFGALAGFLGKTPHIALADTESSGIYDSIFSKFVQVLITSVSYKRNLRKDQIRIDSNIELFYLHPKHYKPPTEPIKSLSLAKNESYALLRFVNWEAYHDKGLSGFSSENKIRVVQELSKYMRVFISSEGTLPKELEPFKIEISFDKMHDVISKSNLFFGEGASMAAEAAVLGVPAIFLNDNWSGNALDLTKHELMYCYKSSSEEQNNAITKAIEIATQNDKIYYQEKRKIYLEKKLDASSFLCWFITHYPISKKEVLKNPSNLADLI